MKFEVSGKQYEFDMAPERLMGDEVMILDARLATGWAARWARLDLGVGDIVVLTYLAAKRAGDQRAFDEFVPTIAPLTFKPIELDTPAASPAPARAQPADAIGPALRSRRKSSAKTAG